MFARQLAHSIGRQQMRRPVNRSMIRRQKGFDCAGMKRLGQPISRIVLVLCPIWLGVNLLLMFTVNHMDKTFSTMDKVRHELMDQNIGLRAQKARLFSPGQLEVRAGRQLGLRAPVKVMSENKLDLYVPSRNHLAQF